MAKADSSKNQYQRGGSLKSFEQAAGATKNLRRFGQSIKRVVREVKEESTVGEPRDVLVARNEQLSSSIKIFNESYQLSLATLVTLHNKYLRSKEVKNVFHRYALLREMIKETAKMESTWWARIDLPKQNRAEPFSAYVLRVCSAIDLVRVPSTLDGVPFKETDAETEARHERVNEMTSKQVNEENEALSNTMYKLLKKYQAIRAILKTLYQEYCDSKIYPMFPRYNILKDMIKDVTHHPDYMEHRHESRVQPE